MGREIRRTPVGWEHPIHPNPNPMWRPSKWDWTGRGRRFQPMHDEPYSAARARWDAEKASWDAGERPDYCTGEDRDLPFEEWHGEAPDPAYYRPEWPADAVLGYQFYETVSEGTPLSPSFATPEELAGFLVERDIFPSRESALRFIGEGWAPSFIGTPSGGLTPGYLAV